MGPAIIKIKKFDTSRVACLVDTTPEQWVAILRMKNREYVRIMGSNYQIREKTLYRMDGYSV